MNATLPFYRKALNDRLVERISRNPKYSLRAFAQALGMESGALSKILNGTRFMSEALATKLMDRLDLSAEDREEFLASLARARVTAGLKRMSPTQKMRITKSGAPRELTVDVFKTVSDWYHYAILELVRVKGFKNDPSWIAQRLGISESEAIGAVDRLLLLELLAEKEGKLVNTSYYLNTANREISSAALRRRQKQIIEKSLYSLEHHPIQIRNHSARTLALSKEKIPEAKKRIEEFMIKICDELAAGEKEEVYELSVQLFPLEKNPRLEVRNK